MIQSNNEIKAKSYKFHEIVNKLTQFNNQDELSSIDIKKLKIKPEVFFGITRPQKLKIKFI